MAGPDQIQRVWTFDFGRWSRRLYYCLALILLIHFGLYLRSAGLLFPFPYEFKGWADGHVMYTAGQISRGENPYPDPNQTPSASFCYTPGFQLLAAPLIRWFGLEMWVGRLVAISGLILVWLMVYLASKGEGGDRWAGILGVGLLMAPYACLHSHYDDIHPDSWCVAMGLICLAATEATTRNRHFWIAAAIAAWLSFVFKQTGASFAAGAFVFLLVRRPRQALYFAGLYAALLIAFILAGMALTDGMFIDYIFTAAKDVPILWWSIPWALFFIGKFFVFTLLAALFLAVDHPRRLALGRAHAVTLPFVFLLYGSASIRLGGDLLSNVFPTAVLVSILLAPAIRRTYLEARASQPKLAFMLLLLVTVQGLWLFQEVPSVPTPQHYQTGRLIDQLVQSTPGEVLVFYRISFAYRNHRPVYDNWGIISDHYNWKDYSRLENQLRTSFFDRVFIPLKSIDWWWKDQPAYQFLLANYDLEQTISNPPWHQTTPMLVYRRKNPAE